MKTPTDRSRTSRVAGVDRIGRTSCVTGTLGSVNRSFVLSPWNAPLFAARGRHVLGPSQPMGNLKVVWQQRRLPTFAANAAPGPLDKFCVGSGEQVRVCQQINESRADHL